MAALTALNWKIAALTALNWKNSGVKRQIKHKIAALTAFFVGIKALKAFNGKITAITECNRKNNGLSDVQQEKSRR